MAKGGRDGVARRGAPNLTHNLLVLNGRVSPQHGRSFSLPSFKISQTKKLGFWQSPAFLFPIPLVIRQDGDKANLITFGSCLIDRNLVGEVCAS